LVFSLLSWCRRGVRRRAGVILERGLDVLLDLVLDGHGGTLDTINRAVEKTSDPAPCGET